MSFVKKKKMSFVKNDIYKEFQMTCKNTKESQGTNIISWINSKYIKGENNLTQ